MSLEKAELGRDLFSERKRKPPVFNTIDECFLIFFIIFTFERNNKGERKEKILA